MSLFHAVDWRGHMEPIKALPLLGVTAGNACDYCVRLSKVMPHLDPNEWLRDPSPAARDRLRDHLFGHIWPDTAPGRKHSMKGSSSCSSCRSSGAFPPMLSWGPSRLARSSGRPAPANARRSSSTIGATTRSRIFINTLGSLGCGMFVPAYYCGMDYRLDHKPFAETCSRECLLRGRHRTKCRIRCRKNTASDAGKMNCRRPGPTDPRVGAPKNPLASGYSVSLRFRIRLHPE